MALPETLFSTRQNLPPSVIGFFGVQPDALRFFRATVPIHAMPTPIQGSWLPLSSSVLRGILRATPVEALIEIPAAIQQKSVTTLSHSEHHRAREWAWRKANIRRLRSEFPGEWIVLEGEEIIAHGLDPVELVKTARARGVRSPYIFHVGRESRPRTSFLGI